MRCLLFVFSCSVFLYVHMFSFCSLIWVFAFWIPFASNNQKYCRQWRHSFRDVRKNNLKSGYSTPIRKNPSPKARGERVSRNK